MASGLSPFSSLAPAEYRIQRNRKCHHRDTCLCLLRGSFVFDTLAYHFSRQKQCRPHARNIARHIFYLTICHRRSFANAGLSCLTINIDALRRKKEEGASGEEHHTHALRNLSRQPPRATGWRGGEANVVAMNGEVGVLVEAEEEEHAEGEVCVFGVRRIR